MTMTPTAYRAAAAQELRNAAADRRDAARETGTMRARWIASAGHKIKEARWCRTYAQIAGATGGIFEGAA